MKIKYRVIVKLLAAILTVTFLAQDVSMAAMGLKPSELKPILFPVFQFKIPQSVGVLEDRFQGAPGKHILLVADPHTNESGQKNIAKALDLVLDREKIRYIFLEAGTGDDSLSSFRAKASKDVRRQVADSYVRKGLLNGAEYLDLVSDDHEFKLWGVEDKSLYWESIEAYRFIAKHREAFKEYLKKIDQTVQYLKGRLYPDALLAFDKKREAYLKNEISLTDYFDVLLVQAKKFNLPIEQFKSLVTVAEIQKLERGIRFDVANRELEQAVTDLPEVGANGRSPLLARLGRTQSDAAFFALLKDSVKDFSRYPELSKYLAYQDASKKLAAKEFLAELALFEKVVYAALSVSRDAHRLHEIDDNLRLLERLLDLSVTEDEYALYHGTPDAFDVTKITGFLNRQIALLGSGYERAVFLKPAYKSVFRKAERFYELTYERDERFVRNMLAKMNESSTDRAVLVTGGYHLPNLKAILKKEGVSYVCLTPQVLAETNRKRYEGILLGQRERQATSDKRQAESAPYVSAPNVEFKQGDVATNGSCVPLATLKPQIASAPESRNDHIAILPAAETEVGARLAKELTDDRLKVALQTGGRMDALEEADLAHRDEYKKVRPTKDDEQSAEDTPWGARLAASEPRREGRGGEGMADEYNQGAIEVSLRQWATLEVRQFEQSLTKKALKYLHVYDPFEYAAKSMAEMIAFQPDETRRAGFREVLRRISDSDPPRPNTPILNPEENLLRLTYTYLQAYEMALSRTKSRRNFLGQTVVTAVTLAVNPSSLVNLSMNVGRITSTVREKVSWTDLSKIAYGNYRELASALTQDDPNMSESGRQLCVDMFVKNCFAHYVPAVRVMDALQKKMGLDVQIPLKLITFPDSATGGKSNPTIVLEQLIRVRIAVQEIVPVLKAMPYNLRQTLDDLEHAKGPEPKWLDLVEDVAGGHRNVIQARRREHEEHLAQLKVLYEQYQHERDHEAAGHKLALISDKIRQDILKLQMIIDWLKGSENPSMAGARLADDFGSKPRPFQFSLLSFLSATTAFAMWLSMVIPVNRYAIEQSQSLTAHFHEHPNPMVALATAIGGIFGWALVNSLIILVPFGIATGIVHFIDSYYCRIHLTQLMEEVLTTLQLTDSIKKDVIGELIPFALKQSSQWDLTHFVNEDYWKRLVTELVAITARPEDLRLITSLILEKKKAVFISFNNQDRWTYQIVLPLARRCSSPEKGLDTAEFKRWLGVITKYFQFERFKSLDDSDTVVLSEGVWNEIETLIVQAKDFDEFKKKARELSKTAMKELDATHIRGYLFGDDEDDAPGARLSQNAPSARREARVPHPAELSLNQFAGMRLANGQRTLMESPWGGALRDYGARFAFTNYLGEGAFNNATWPLRHLAIYKSQWEYLADPNNHRPLSVLLIGPGVKNRVSFQTIETASLLAHFARPEDDRCRLDIVDSNSYVIQSVNRLADPDESSLYELGGRNGIVDERAAFDLMMPVLARNLLDRHNTAITGSDLKKAFGGERSSSFRVNKERLLKAVTIHANRSNLLQYQPPKNTYDMIVATHVLHHFFATKNIRSTSKALDYLAGIIESSKGDGLGRVWIDRYSTTFTSEKATDDAIYGLFELDNFKKDLETVLAGRGLQVSIRFIGTNLLEIVNNTPTFGVRHKEGGPLLGANDAPWGARLSAEQPLQTISGLFLNVPQGLLNESGAIQGEAIFPDASGASILRPGNTQGVKVLFIDWLQYQREIQHTSHKKRPYAERVETFLPHNVRSLQAVVFYNCHMLGATEHPRVLAGQLSGVWKNYLKNLTVIATTDRLAKWDHARFYFNLPYNRPYDGRSAEFKIGPKAFSGARFAEYENPYQSPNFSSTLERRPSRIVKFFERFVGGKLSKFHLFEIGFFWPCFGSLFLITSTLAILETYFVNKKVLHDYFGEIILGDVLVGGTAGVVIGAACGVWLIYANKRSSDGARLADLSRRDFMKSMAALAARVNILDIHAIAEEYLGSASPDLVDTLTFVVKKTSDKATRWVNTLQALGPVLGMVGFEKVSGTGRAESVYMDLTDDPAHLCSEILNSLRSEAASLHEKAMLLRLDVVHSLQTYDGLKAYLDEELRKNRIMIGSAKRLDAFEKSAHTENVVSKFEKKIAALEVHRANLDRIERELEPERLVSLLSQVLEKRSQDLFGLQKEYGPILQQWAEGVRAYRILSEQKIQRRAEQDKRSTNSSEEISRSANEAELGTEPSSALEEAQLAYEQYLKASYGDVFFWLREVSRFMSYLRAGARLAASEPRRQGRGEEGMADKTGDGRIRHAAVMDENTKTLYREARWVLDRGADIQRRTGNRITNEWLTDQLQRRLAAYGEKSRSLSETLEAVFADAPLALPLSVNDVSALRLLSRTAKRRALQQLGEGAATSVAAPFHPLALSRRSLLKTAAMLGISLTTGGVGGLGADGAQAVLKELAILEEVPRSLMEQCVDLFTVHFFENTAPPVLRSSTVWENEFADKMKKSLLTKMIREKGAIAERVRQAREYIYNESEAWQKVLPGILRPVPIEEISYHLTMDFLMPEKGSSGSQWNENPAINGRERYFESFWHSQAEALNRLRTIFSGIESVQRLLQDNASKPRDYTRNVLGEEVFRKAQERYEELAKSLPPDEVTRQISQYMEEISPELEQALTQLSKKEKDEASKFNQAIYDTAVREISEKLTQAKDELAVLNQKYAEEHNKTEPFIPFENISSGLRDELLQKETALQIQIGSLTYKIQSLEAQLKTFSSLADYLDVAILPTTESTGPHLDEAKGDASGARLAASEPLSDRYGKKPAKQSFISYPQEEFNVNAYPLSSERIAKKIIEMVTAVAKQNGCDFNNRYAVEHAGGNYLRDIIYHLLSNIAKHENDSSFETSKTQAPAVLRVYWSQTPVPGVRVEFWGAGKYSFPKEFNQNEWFTAKNRPWRYVAPSTARSFRTGLGRGVTDLFDDIADLERTAMNQETVRVGWRPDLYNEGPTPNGHIIALHFSFETSAEPNTFINLLHAVPLGEDGYHQPASSFGARLSQNAPSARREARVPHPAELSLNQFAGFAGTRLAAPETREEILSEIKSRYPVLEPYLTNGGISVTDEKLKALGSAYIESNSTIYIKPDSPTFYKLARSYPFETSSYFPYDTRNGMILKEALALADLVALGREGLVPELEAVGVESYGSQFFVKLKGLANAESLNRDYWSSLTPLEKIDMLIQITETLKKVHQANWLHNDIMPANILVQASVDHDGTKSRAMLADFGVSIYLGDREGAEDHVQNPYAEVPESFRTRASDIYRLGVVLKDYLDFSAADLAASGLIGCSQAMMATDPKARPSIDEVLRLLKTSREYFKTLPSDILAPLVKVRELPVESASPENVVATAYRHPRYASQDFLVIKNNSNEVKEGSLRIPLSETNGYFPDWVFGRYQLWNKGAAVNFEMWDSERRVYDQFYWGKNIRLQDGEVKIYYKLSPNQRHVWVPGSAASLKGARLTERTNLDPRIGVAVEPQAILISNPVYWIRHLLRNPNIAEVHKEFRRWTTGRNREWAFAFSANTGAKNFHGAIGQILHRWGLGQPFGLWMDNHEALLEQQMPLFSRKGNMIFDRKVAKALWLKNPNLLRHVVAHELFHKALEQMLPERRDTLKQGFANFSRTESGSKYINARLGVYGFKNHGIALWPEFYAQLFYPSQSMNGHVWEASRYGNISNPSTQMKEIVTLFVTDRRKTVEIFPFLREINRDVIRDANRVLRQMKGVFDKEGGRLAEGQIDPHKLFNVLSITSAVVLGFVVVNFTVHQIAGGPSLWQQYFELQKTHGLGSAIAAAATSVITGCSARFIGMYMSDTLTRRSPAILSIVFSIQLGWRLIHGIYTDQVNWFIEAYVKGPLAMTLVSLTAGIFLSAVFDFFEPIFLAKLDARSKESSGNQDEAREQRHDVRWGLQWWRVRDGVMGRLAPSFFQHALTQILFTREKRVFVLLSIGFLNNIYRTTIAFMRKPKISPYRVFLAGLASTALCFTLMPPSTGVTALTLTVVSAWFFRKNNKQGSRFASAEVPLPPNPYVTDANITRDLSILDKKLSGELMTAIQDVQREYAKSRHEGWPFRKKTILLIGVGAGRTLYDLREQYRHLFNFKFINKEPLAVYPKLFIRMPGLWESIEKFFNYFQRNVQILDVEQEGALEQYFNSCDWVIVESSVFCYIKDKAKLIRAIKNCLRSGGLALIPEFENSLTFEDARVTAKEFFDRVNVMAGSMPQYEIIENLLEPQVLKIKNIYPRTSFPNLEMSDKQPKPKKIDVQDIELPPQYQTVYKVPDFMRQGARLAKRKSSSEWQSAVGAVFAAWKRQKNPDTQKPVLKNVYSPQYYLDHYGEFAIYYFGRDLCVHLLPNKVSRDDWGYLFGWEKYLNERLKKYRQDRKSGKTNTFRKTAVRVGFFFDVKDTLEQALHSNNHALASFGNADGLLRLTALIKASDQTYYLQGLSSLLRSRESVALLLGIQADHAELKNWRMPLVLFTVDQLQALQHILKYRADTKRLSELGLSDGYGIYTLIRSIKAGKDSHCDKITSERVRYLLMLHGISWRSLTTFLADAGNVASLLGLHVNDEQLLNWNPPIIGLTWRQGMALKKVLWSKAKEGKLADLGDSELDGLKSLLREIKTNYERQSEPGYIADPDLLELWGINLGELTTLLMDRSKVRAMLGIPHPSRWPRQYETNMPPLLQSILDQTERWRVHFVSITWDQFLQDPDLTKVILKKYERNREDWIADLRKWGQDLSSQERTAENLAKVSDSGNPGEKVTAVKIHHAVANYKIPYGGENPIIVRQVKKRFTPEEFIFKMRHLSEEMRKGLSVENTPADSHPTTTNIAAFSGDGRRAGDIGNYAAHCVKIHKIKSWGEAGIIRNQLLFKTKREWAAYLRNLSKAVPTDRTPTPKCVATLTGGKYSAADIRDVLWYFEIPYHAVNMKRLPVQQAEWTTLVTDARAKILKEGLPETFVNLVNAMDEKITADELYRMNRRFHKTLVKEIFKGRSTEMWWKMLHDLTDRLKKKGITKPSTADTAHEMNEIATDTEFMTAERIVRIIWNNKWTETSPVNVKMVGAKRRLTASQQGLQAEFIDGAKEGTYKYVAGKPREKRPEEMVLTNEFWNIMENSVSSYEPEDNELLYKLVLAFKEDPARTDFEILSETLGVSVDTIQKILEELRRVAVQAGWAPEGKPLQDRRLRARRIVPSKIKMWVRSYCTKAIEERRARVAAKIKEREGGKPWELAELGRELKLDYQTVEGDLKQLGLLDKVIKPQAPEIISERRQRILQRVKETPPAPHKRWTTGLLAVDLTVDNETLRNDLVYLHKKKLLAPGLVVRERGRGRGRLTEAHLYKARQDKLQKILDEARSKGIRFKISELSRMLGQSHTTINTDLKALDKVDDVNYSGLIQRMSRRMLMPVDERIELYKTKIQELSKGGERPEMYRLAEDPDLKSKIEGLDYKMVYRDLRARNLLDLVRAGYESGFLKDKGARLAKGPTDRGHEAPDLAAEGYSLVPEANNQDPLYRLAGAKGIAYKVQRHGQTVAESDIHFYVFDELRTIVISAFAHGFKEGADGRPTELFKIVFWKPEYEGYQIIARAPKDLQVLFMKAESFSPSTELRFNNHPRVMAEEFFLTDESLRNIYGRTTDATKLVRELLPHVSLHGVVPSFLRSTTTIQVQAKIRTFSKTATKHLLETMSEGLQDLGNDIRHDPYAGLVIPAAWERSEKLVASLADIRKDFDKTNKLLHCAIEAAMSNKLSSLEKICRQIIQHLRHLEKHINAAPKSLLTDERRHLWLGRLDSYIQGISELEQSSKPEGSRLTGEREKKKRIIQLCRQMRGGTNVVEAIDELNLLVREGAPILRRSEKRLTEIKLLRLLSHEKRLAKIQLEMERDRKAQGLESYDMTRGLNLYQTELHGLDIIQDIINTHKRLIRQGILRPGEPMRILDIGCGHGNFLNEIANHPRLKEARITLLPHGLALKPREEWKRQHRGIQFHTGIAEAMPETWKGLFHYVVSVRTIQYSPDVLRFLEETYRVLAPGGVARIANRTETPGFAMPSWEMLFGRMHVIGGVRIYTSYYYQPTLNLEKGSDDEELLFPYELEGRNAYVPLAGARLADEKLKQIDRVMQEIDQEIRQERPEKFLARNGDVQYLRTPAAYGTAVIEELAQKNLMNRGRKFGDIGAGTGSMLLLAVALTDIDEAIGIEPDEYLRGKGQKAIDRLHKMGVIDKTRIRWIADRWENTNGFLSGLDAAYLYSPLKAPDTWLINSDEVRSRIRPNAYLYVGGVGQSGWGTLGGRIKDLDSVFSSISQGKQIRALDVGTGQAEFCDNLAKAYSTHFSQIVGIDHAGNGTTSHRTNNVAIEIQHGVSFESFANDPANYQKFDVIFCNNSCTNIFTSFEKSARKILRPGGKIIVTAFWAKPMTGLYNAFSSRGQVNRCLYRYAKSSFDGQDVTFKVVPTLEGYPATFYKSVPGFIVVELLPKLLFSQVHKAGARMAGKDQGALEKLVQVAGNDLNEDLGIDKDKKTFAAHIDRLKVKPGQRAIDIGPSMLWMAGEVLALHGCDVDVVEPAQGNLEDYYDNIKHDLVRFFKNDSRLVDQALSRVHKHPQGLIDFLNDNPDAKFDLVVASNILDLFAMEYVFEETLSKLWRSLNDGAKLIVSMHGNQINELEESASRAGLEFDIKSFDESYTCFLAGAYRYEIIVHRRSDAEGARLAESEITADRIAWELTPGIFIIPDEVCNIFVGEGGHGATIPPLPPETLEQAIRSVYAELTAAMPSLTRLSVREKDEIKRRLFTSGHILLKRSSIKNLSYFEKILKHELVHREFGNVGGKTAILQSTYHNGIIGPNGVAGFEVTVIFSAGGPEGYGRKPDHPEFWAQWLWNSVGEEVQWRALKNNVYEKSKEDSNRGRLLSEALKAIEELKDSVLSQTNAMMPQILDRLQKMPTGARLTSVKSTKENLFEKFNLNTAHVVQGAETAPLRNIYDARLAKNVITPMISTGGQRGQTPVSPNLQDFLLGVRTAYGATAVNGSRVAFDDEKGQTHVFRLADENGMLVAKAANFEVKLESTSGKKSQVKQAPKAEPKLSVQDLRTLDDATDAKVKAFLDQVEIITTAPLIIDINPDFVDEASFEAYAQYLVALVAALKADSAGKNVFFKVSGMKGERLRLTNPAAESLFLTQIPEELKNTKVVRLAPTNDSLKSTVNLPVAQMREGDLFGFRPMLRLAIYAGRIDLASIPDRFSAAYETLAGEKLATGTLRSILDGSASLELRGRFSLKPLIQTVLADTLRYLKMAKRMVEQAA